ncbi:MAG: CNNM domain-containing protein [Deferrisomatales bacterium]|nr:CNNM domain-containing protein [Deferrisomatales bacterium]
MTDVIPSVSHLPWFIALLAVLLVFSAFFSGAETALLGIDWLRVRYLVRTGSRRARMVQTLLERKDLLLGTILVGNNVVNIGASAVATAVALSLFGEQGIVVATGVMTLLVLVFSEIAPKTFASQHGEPVALAVAPLFVVLNRVLFPVSFLVTRLARMLLTLCGVDPVGRPRVRLSEDEIRVLIAEGAAASTVEEDKRHMLHGIFQMGRQTAREVMIPRTRVRGIEVNTPIQEAAQVFVSSGYTRLPVYRDTLDEVVGVAHARDVLAVVAGAADTNLATIAREPFYVPESKDLESLLYDFKLRRTHLALVVDEYGGVEGIVTLEDLLEEIVGEIRDEHDVETESIRFLPGGEVLVRGAAAVRDVNRQLGLHLPTGPDVTVGGFVMTRLGHIPKRGESFPFGTSAFTVERTGHNRVLLVRVTPLDDKAGAGLG